MKKITFLLFLAYLTTYSETLDIREFKITNTEYSITPGQTIFYDFIIEGDYGYNEIELSIYHGNYNPENKIAYSRWNREGDNNLSFPVPTNKHWYSGTFLDYNRDIKISGEKFLLVAKFGSQTKTLIYNVPNTIPEVKNFYIKTDNKSFTQGGRIDYRFDIQGIYKNKEIQLKLYYENVSQENLISYSRWNREGDLNLNFPEYETIDWWNITYDDHNILFEGKKFYLVITLNGNSKTLEYEYHAPIHHTFKYCGDNEKEAKINWCKKNPGYEIEANFNGYNGISLTKNILIMANIEGTVKYYEVVNSNEDKRAETTIDFRDTYDYWMPCNNTTPNPDDPNEINYDLKFNINGSNISSDASSSSLTATHRLDHSYSKITFNFIIDNIGSDSSSPTQIEFYRSGDAKFSKSDDAELAPKISIPSISSGSSKGYYSKTFFNSDFESGLSENWYIIARIKAEDKDTINNNLAVKVYFNPTRSSFSRATAQTSATQRNIKIYNFAGVPLVDKTVNSEQEEWETVKSLQPGLYIVKSGDKTYKVKN